MTFSIFCSIQYLYSECHNAECLNYLNVMMSVVMLNVVMLSVEAPENNIKFLSSSQLDNRVSSECLATVLGVPVCLSVCGRSCTACWLQSPIGCLWQRLAKDPLPSYVLKGAGKTTSLLSASFRYGNSIFGKLSWPNLPSLSPHLAYYGFPTNVFPSPSLFMSPSPSLVPFPLT